MVQVFESDNESFSINDGTGASIDGFSASSGFGSANTEKDPRFQHPAQESSNQNQTYSTEQENLLEKLRNLSPLNLKLQITQSFMHQLESILSPQNNNNNTHCITQLNQTSAAYHHADYISQQMTEKKKAKTIPATVLRIGAWERVCRHDGDLVAKFYYAKKKLVWECLERSLKRKMEIQWADILAIRTIIQENEPGILELELMNPPTFYHEIDPQPRKHTIWKVTTDFTEGQAPVWRKHYLKFPPGVLDSPFEKLLQCDNRLFELSQKPFPSLESPYFQSSFYGIPDFSLNFNPQRPQIYGNLHDPAQHFPTQQYLPAQQVQAYQPIQQPFSFKDSAPPNSDELPRMPFWGQTTDNFAAAESVARNQVPGQFTDASTIPPVVSYQGNNYIESGNMQHSFDAQQMQIDNLKQILLADSEIEYPEDDESTLARTASFSALINQSMEGNLGINDVENYLHDTCTSPDLDCSGNEHLIDTAPGQLCPQPVSWMPRQVTDDIPQSISSIQRQLTDDTQEILMSQFRNSNSFYPMRDDFSTVNNNNGVNKWP